MRCADGLMSPAGDSQRAMARLALAAALTAALAAPVRAVPVAPAVVTTDARDVGASEAAVRTLLDSARLWRRHGRDDLAHAALTKLLSIEPGHREALAMLTAIAIEEEHFAEAERLLARLEHASPDSRDATELRALFGTARTQGVPLVRSRLRAIGRGEQPDSRIATAPRPVRAPARPRTARAAGRPPQALEPVRSAAAVVPAPAAAPVPPDPAELARLRRAEADAALVRDDEAAALAALQEAVRLDPLSAWARFDLARLLERRGDRSTARRTIDDGLAMAPEDPEMAYAAALYYAGIDADAEARTTLARIDRPRWSDGMRSLDTRLRVGERLAVARARADAGDTAAARAALAEATTLAPDDPSVLVRAGWTAQSTGDYTQSRRYFDRAVAVTGPGGSTDEADAARRGIAHLESRRQRFVTSGIEYSDKPGERGVSRFDRHIVPVELRWAIDYERSVFAHADYLDLGAGRLDLTDYASVTRYGQLLAAGPPGPGGSRHPGASGVMFGAGYEDPHWRFDAGHLPGAFPVSYAVGGVRYTTRSHGIDWSAELARRPVTSTLISFAGVHDPASGEIWGGARRTGLTLNASRELFGHEAYGRLALNAIDGRNIADNTEVELRAGYDWYTWARENSRVTVGTSATFWHFTRNQRFQTFGHGGYYSPQSYLSLGLPVQWSGSRGRWSWRVRASAGWSTTHEDDAPYHPTDTALQARAAAQAAANDFAAPIHEGGSGGGFSGSGAGAIEYRLTDAWSIGARFEFDRSEDYSPDTVGLWFRYRFNARGTFYGAPRPPRVYAYY